MKIELPNTFLGVNTAEALERILKDETKTPIAPQTPTNIKNLDGYIYVPSIKLYVARERTLQNYNWHDAHKELKKQNERMLTLYELVEFLNHVENNNPDIYEDMTAVRDPARGEWIDAYFEKRKDGMHMLTGNKTKSEKLESYLEGDKTPGIDLESWLKNPTKQGLPRSDIKDGSLYYWHPRDKSVARFDAFSDGAYLYCNGDPQGSSGGIRVRRAREK